MSVPQHIVALLEDYLDGRLDEPGREVVSSWVRQSAEHAAELAAWFATEVELL